MKVINYALLYQKSDFMRVISITLAAGNGTRMKSDLPKPLHTINGFSMLELSQNCLKNISKYRILVASNDLIKHGAEICANFDEIVIQKEKLGTGHAVKQCISLVNQDDLVIINYGDTPFVKESTISKMVEKLSTFHAVFLGFCIDDLSKKYGRFVVNGEILSDIIEYKDASEDQRNINLCNAGIIAIRGSALLYGIDKINNNNANKEYYLTDIVKILHANLRWCGYEKCLENEAIGVDSQDVLLHARSLVK